MAQIALPELLACIRKHQERLDFEIAAEIGAPLGVVRQLGAELIATGSIIGCTVTRFADGDRVDAWLYRVSGYVPKPAPGRRPRAPA